MSRENTIDVSQESVDLFKKEDMVAFFDFTFNCRDSGPVDGLCKISRPKAGQSSMNYFSLLFIVDTPDREIEEQIQKVTGRLNEENLRASLGGMPYSVLMPSVSVREKICIKQVDIILEAPCQAKVFITGKLFPAVLSITGFSSSGLIWWQEKEPVAQSSSPPQENLIERIKRSLFGH